MQLWLLKRLDHVSWDEFEGFVVRAKTRERAREIASKKAGEEGEMTWLDALKTSCEPIEDVGEEETILEAFNAG